MAPPMARWLPAAVPALPAAGGFFLGDLPYQACVGLVAVGAVAYVAGRVLDYLLGRAAIAKSDPAHVAEVVAAVNGHPAPSSDIGGATTGEGS